MGKVAERLQRFNSLSVEKVIYPISEIGKKEYNWVLFFTKKSVSLAHEKSMATAVLLFLKK